MSNTGGPHDDVVPSTSSQTLRNTNNTEIDIEAGGGVGGGGHDPPDSMTNEGGTGGNSSRPWRLDFDLNFDPSWLVSRGSGAGVRASGLQGPLSMLNDWVRSSIPGGSGSGAQTQNAGVGDTARRASAISVGNNNGSGNGTESSQLGTASRIGGRRMTPPHHGHNSHRRTSTAAATLADEEQIGDIENGASESQAFIVDMGSGNGSGAAGNGGGWNGGTGTGNAQSPSDDPAQSRVVPDTPGREPSSPQNLESPNSDTAASDVLRFRQSPEARAIMQIVERYTPFVLILFIKGIFDHGSGILCFLALLITFSHANSLFKKEVAKQGKRNLFYVVMIIVNLCICISFMYYVFDDQKLYPALGFMPTNLEINSIWALLWVVGVTDYIAKFLTIICKCVFLALPEAITPFQKRGKYYLFVEQTSQLYRSLLPLHPYFIFLFDSYDGTLQVFGFILTGVYILFKIGDVLQRLKAWRVAFHKLLQQTHYGFPPTEEQLSNVGGHCPICHDTFSHPTRLSCSHIFCEECVSTWFDRERTCPMCRAKVVDDPAYRDGSTAHFIQLF